MSENNKEDEGVVNSLAAKPEDICPECGHKEKYHFIDEDWTSCSAGNWSCNCGNNIGR